MYNVPDRRVNGAWIKSYIEVIDGKKYRCTTRSGKLWAGIGSRVSDKFKAENPTYSGKHNLFKDFQHFAEWCQEQYGYLNKTDNGRFWHLDKDLLIENSSYGPETCIFVPEYINTLFVRPRMEQKYLLGVTRRNPGKGMKSEYTKPFVIRGFCREEQKDVTFYFESEIEAHKKWQDCKVAKIDFLLSTRYDISNHTQLILALETTKMSIQDDIDNHRISKR